MKLPLSAGVSLLVLAASLAAASPARALYSVTFSQNGPDVVANGSGTLNINGLRAARPPAREIAPLVYPTQSMEIAGAAAATNIYDGTISGPGNFGDGYVTRATTGTGPIAGVDARGEIFVPTGYISRRPLSDTATYEGQTLATLGVAPGLYTYSFGSGANADEFQVVITGVSALLNVPEPASLALLGTALLGFGLIRRRRT